ncbi:MAG TPA: deoxyguanosinetriphosphate triphosphohydrolase [Deltaproteobacteria bacterium]|nr:MAG: deoxyguanosinetriphosphate triphosphohydrolase [Deltaproteobacteria bacterium GWA2_45_12]HBF12668.1 deoxyguanosinetriphosphate triphosphohydrolase [Deltaproteobacteria bacterium]
MITRQEFEKIEEQIMAPYAVSSGRSEGRIYPEKEHAYRTCFQRDRDRVIHSRAFRRLEYKTQVFVNHEGDYYRTRLTHSLEVAQIARSIARSLRLNEDLAEGVSLAHDLGHTPFGHSGEHVMSRLMKEFGGFEHNKQSFRVVTLLEDRYPLFPGLNLTYEFLEGITKHRSEYDLPEGGIFERKGYPTLEAQLCNFADEIAYNNHDIDDGLKSGMISLEQLKDVEIWQTHFEPICKKMATHPVQMQILQCVRALINFQVTDLITETLRNIEKLKIKNLDDVKVKAKNCVSFSEKVQKQNQELKRFLLQNLYRHYRVIRMADKAERIITELFKAYVKNPKIIPPDFLNHYVSIKKMFPQKAEKNEYGEQVERIVCDYIAGMTDRFALDEYKKLFDPHEKV